MKNIRHILISRTDNIGDVILTLPLAGILKQYFPGAKITFLAREYVRAIAEHCSHIDTFLSWDRLSQMKKPEAIAYIKAQAIDVVIHGFPNRLIGVLMKQAGVRYRIGTSHRLHHWFTCNERVNFTRSHSDLHEAQLNLNLLKPFNVELNNNLTYLREMMGFSCNEPLSLQMQLILAPNKFNLIIHPFTNGHTREWPVSHFIALINQLPHEQFNIIVTGSENENRKIQDEIMPHCPQVINFAGRCSLQEFIQLISQANGLIVNSTGPLHIAAALGIPTLGLFPSTKGMDINRWGPLGKKAEVIIADPNCNAPTCMESITVDQVKNKIINWLQLRGI